MKLLLISMMNLFIIIAEPANASEIRDSRLLYDSTGGFIGSSHYDQDTGRVYFYNADGHFVNNMDVRGKGLTNFFDANGIYVGSIHQEMPSYKDDLSFFPTVKLVYPY